MFVCAQGGATTAPDAAAACVPTPICAALSAPDAGRGAGELLFLGTGSASPSKYRNVSAILLSLPRGGLLMDCDEGTYAQLVRRYGVGGTAALLRRLRCIFITHMHADHTLGLAELLVQRRQAFASSPDEAAEPSPAVFSGAAAWPWWPW